MEIYFTRTVFMFDSVRRVATGRTATVAISRDADTARLTEVVDMLPIDCDMSLATFESMINQGIYLGRSSIGH